MALRLYLILLCIKIDPKIQASALEANIAELVIISGIKFDSEFLFRYASL